MHTAIGLVLLLFSPYYIKPSNCVNILLLEAVPSPSHHLWLSKLSTTLAAKGYNVTSLSADIDEKQTPNLHYLHLDAVYDRLSKNDIKADYFAKGDASPWQIAALFRKYTNEACEGSVRSIGWKQLQQYPDNFKFDLVLHDHFFGYYMLAFLKKFNYPPTIALTAMNDISIASHAIGAAIVPSTSTHYNKKFLIKNFYDRLDNYLLQMFDYYSRNWYLHPLQDKIIREQGEMIDIPSVNELKHHTKLVMLNYDPAFDPPEHFPPNVIAVGGMQIQAVNQLSEEFQTIMDNAKSGLVLFSLGTNVPVEDLGVERVTHLLEAFRKLPQYTFLCKFVLEKSPLPLPENVIMRKWIPQNDILGHNNTKLFITHSGLMSTQESIWHGVPMLGMPVFADQFLNIDKSIQKGIAGRVFWTDLTADTLSTEIKRIITDPTFQVNSKIISKVFRDQKETPLERAVWWIEWTLRNPNANHMRGISDFNFIQLQSIDVMAFIFVVILLALWLIKLVASYLLKCLSIVISEDKKKKE